MKTLITIALLLASGAAYAYCQDVYDPMTGKWVYVCKEPITTNPNPVCHNEYDPMNGVWVMVCS
jgi:hypothetical protein